MWMSQWIEELMWYKEVNQLDISNTTMKFGYERKERVQWLKGEKIVKRELGFL